MDDRSKNISDEEIEELNVRNVIGVLAFLKTEATDDELLKCFQTSLEPQNEVREEIKRVLDHSVTNGLIVKNANKYALASREEEYQIDGDEDRKGASYRSPKHEDEDEDMDESILDMIDIEPDPPYYEVFSSPSRHEGAEYRRLGGRTPSPSGRGRLRLGGRAAGPSRARTPTPARARTPSPARTRKRKYTKRLPEPTTRKTRSMTRVERSPSPASKRRRMESPRGRGGGGGRGGGRGRGGGSASVR